MKIARHEIDRDGYHEIFERDVNRLPHFIKGGRAASARLGLLTDVARTIYRLGGVYEQGSSTVARAIRVTAQANAALFAFTRLESPPRLFRLGEGPPVTYDQPVPANEAHAGAWLEGFQTALISRQFELLPLLADVPTEILRHAPATSAPEATFQAVDLWRAVWSKPHLTSHPSYIWRREYVASCTGKRGEHAKAVRFLTGPFLDLLAALEQRDSPGFAAALEVALKQHQRFWSATATLRDNMESFVSVDLTAIAALAYDRGIRFEVESDYIPTSWVTGNLFKDESGNRPSS